MSRRRAQASRPGRLTVLALACLVLAPLAGCAPVRPWERGALTHRCMQVAPQPSRAMLREHAMSVREAAQGGLGAAGAGCGCD